MADKHRCTGCGYASGKWLGFCPQCRATGTLVVVGIGTGATAAPVRLGDTLPVEEPRLATGIPGVDRVVGGGLVPGSLLLIGGEPGVGKSTLLLQLAARVAAGSSVLYVSAEESTRQIAIRARRMAPHATDVLVHAESDVEAIVSLAMELQPSLLIVDSVQTVASCTTGGAAGGISQTREAGAKLARLAKDTGIAVALIGHVTKDGSLAGPKVLEHLVDTVLYLEGDPANDLRMLRSLKNRFGPAFVVALFEMTGGGLREVEQLPTDSWSGAVPGTVMFPALEGRRPIGVEIQALVASAPGSPARRVVTGVETARVHQLLAVLERHAGLELVGRDVYVNVVGGLRLREPAVDLGIALAVASSALSVPLGKVAAWGEVGLTGEVRPARQHQARHSEALRVGAHTVIAAEPGRSISLECALSSVDLMRPSPVALAG